MPVVAVGQDEVPGFYARSSGIRSPLVAADIAAAARARRDPPRAWAWAAASSCACRCRRTWRSPRTWPATAVEQAVAEAEAAGIGGPALTPWLLARIAEITEGASVRANTALIVHDARVAARSSRSPWADVR